MRNSTRSSYNSAGRTKNFLYTFRSWKFCRAVLLFLI